MPSTRRTLNVAILATGLVWLNSVGCTHSLATPSRTGPMGVSLTSVESGTLFFEPFDQLNLTQWKEIEVNGRTTYTLAELDGTRSLKAESHSGASILLHPLRFNPDTYEWLSWRWRVEQPIEREALDRKGGSDAAARVYVYFDAPGLSWQRRNIDYVWSAHLPVDTILPSAFSKASNIIVVESGVEGLGTWRSASRNIKDDYRRCFGQHPPPALAIGLMTDADNTQTEAVAYFDDVRVSRNPPPTSTATQAP